MKIALLGYGKMGKAVEKEALAVGHEVVLRINSRSLLSKELLLSSQAEVAIEFSRPEVAFEQLKLCLEAGLPVVSGTTGWLEKKPALEALCQARGGAFFYASNFSLGVNLFFAVNRYLAKLMSRIEGYEVSIEEMHHIHKLDAPSGTAVRLAEDLLQHLGHKKRWVKGKTSDVESLSVISRREGEVPGVHLVRYLSAEDELLLKHEAFSRQGFARGALLAAEWLRGRRGCFGMEDLLGLYA